MRKKEGTEIATSFSFLGGGTNKAHATWERMSMLSIDLDDCLFIARVKGKNGRRG